MPSYRTILVGTDGSESSFRAVDRAAALAADAGATLVVACAYRPLSPRERARAAAELGEDSYQVTGAHPAEDLLKDAAARAKAAGATDVSPVAVEGDPVDALVEQANAHSADLLVVGNRGLNSLAGRLLGSVPANVSHRARCDVLIVYTTGRSQLSGRPLGAAQPAAGGIEVSLPGDGVRLAATRWPGTGPPVVLLHGLASQRRFWNLVVPHLAGLPLYAIDQRGHGDSEAPDDGYGYDAVTADLATALDAVGVSRAVVVGHSWGASVALAFAAAHPQRVLSVVAIDGGFSAPQDGESSREQLRERLAPPRLALPPAELTRLLATGPLAPWWDEAVAAAVLATFAVGDDGLARSRLTFDRHMRIVDALLDYDPAAVLARVGAPCWLVSCEPVSDADGDGWSLRWGRRKAAGLERAAVLLARPRLLRWLGALHDVPLQWPALVAGLVREAAQDTRRGAPGP